MSVPPPGRVLAVLGAERLDPDGAEQYPFLAAPGIQHMASTIRRM
jgi:hypothetical protein